MSISSQLLILNQTKQNCKSAINLKGVSVTDEAFSVYPDKVRLIPNGGGIYESNIIQYIEGTMVDVNIPSGTTTIAAYSFRSNADHDTSMVTNVSIPNTVTSIGQYAFYGCANIRHLTIPASVTWLGIGAFGSLSSIIDYTFLATVPPTLEGVSVFEFPNEYCVIYVPDESVLAYQTATNWMYISNRIKGISQKPQ